MNKKAYLLLYDDAAGTRKQMQGFIDKIKEIITWRYDLPHCFYIISEASANDLTPKLRALTGEKGMFLIAEVNDNRNGWVTPDTWYLLRHKMHKPKDEK